MHVPISPAILYWGTPVVLVSSLNPPSTSAPDKASTNLSAISSAFWLGHRCMLGFGAESQTLSNIRRTGQCVLNLPSSADTAVASASHTLRAINALASTTGAKTISDNKRARGYRFESDKWAVAGLTPMESEVVEPKRVRECPVQMECKVVGIHEMMGDRGEGMKGGLVAVECSVLRVHVLEEIRMEGKQNRIDPDRWRPTIMSFQQLYGLVDGKLGESVLGRIDEELYRPLVIRGDVEKEGDKGEEAK